MIALSPECFPCFLRQADLAARAHGASESARKNLAARVSRALADVPVDGVPATVATRLQAIIRDELRTDDPFREVKEREFERFGEMVSRAEAQVAASADPMAASVWMSVFGNIMDSGIVDRDSMEGEVNRIAAGDGGRKIPERLRDAM
ncbi:MAG TPA: ARMT1-like domain-containing protein, partial [Candidatus Deferrimicrobiaceae bacterium]|nr:ARMT1-like domain-containing protein [Candidatus Deferrimicrobiaceae bacterium]